MILARLVIVFLMVVKMVSGQLRWVHQMQHQQAQSGIRQTMVTIGLSQTGQQRLGIPLLAIVATLVGRWTMSERTAIAGLLLLFRAAPTTHTTCSSATMAMSTPQTTAIAATGSLCVVSENSN